MYKHSAGCAYRKLKANAMHVMYELICVLYMICMSPLFCQKRIIPDCKKNQTFTGLVTLQSVYKNPLALPSLIIGDRK